MVKLTVIITAHDRKNFF